MSLIDINGDAAKGRALIMEASPVEGFDSAQRRADYSLTAESDVVIITAGCSANRACRAMTLATNAKIVKECAMQSAGHTQLGTYHCE